MIVKNGQIFNLMDTNGRRNDVINALQIYLKILENLINTQKMTWNNAPKSSAQFEFYKEAIESSPDIFKKHEKYDLFLSELEKSENRDFKIALETNKFSEIQKNPKKYEKLFELLDIGIEARARHYTSNLVKLGFADENRNITSVGNILLYPSLLEKDELEKLFPISQINIVYLRQLLKLKIFDFESKRFYSPFILAILMLLKNERFSENEFFEIIQGLSPYSQISDIENFIASYKEGDIVNNFSVEIPAELNTETKLEKSLFLKHFKNQKSSSTSEIYFDFYELLFDFYKNIAEESKQRLLSFYELQKSVLRKAFGKGKSIFKSEKDKNQTVQKFFETNKHIFSENLNKNLYIMFAKSKQLDSIREYSDTTKRIFKATGIISFENGFAELAYTDICKCVFDYDTLKKNIFGNQENPKIDFYQVASVSEILSYNDEKVSKITNEIKSIYKNVSFEEIPNIVAEKRSEEFKKFVLKNYPAEKVKMLLSLFQNRKNDSKIKEIVCEDASVPTIFEYIVGIAWFYFSGKRINLFQSFNLILSADFEPLVHAGGGQGDIVIYEKDKVVMLEATLMDANSQKRGEWEPVLRHSANLKIEEESAGTDRKVTTFFIADEFDYNTINIWKAVSSVSLQSSSDKTKFTTNVIIMPISIEELSSLMSKSNDYDEIIETVRSLFEEDKINFDTQWRKKFIQKIV